MSKAPAKEPPSSKSLPPEPYSENLNLSGDVTAIDVYTASREYIVAQDNLITTRVGWALTINSLSLTAFAAVFALVDAKDAPVADLLLAICIFSLLINLWFYHNLKLAAETSYSISVGYSRVRKASPVLKPLPYATFGYWGPNHHRWRRKALRSANLPGIFAVFWMLLVAWTLLRIGPFEQLSLLKFEEDKTTVTQTVTSTRVRR